MNNLKSVIKIQRYFQFISLILALFILNSCVISFTPKELNDKANANKRLFTVENYSDSLISQSKTTLFDKNILGMHAYAYIYFNIKKINISDLSAANNSLKINLDVSGWVINSFKNFEKNCYNITLSASPFLKDKEIFLKDLKAETVSCFDIDLMGVVKITDKELTSKIIDYIVSLFGRKEISLGKLSGLSGFFVKNIYIGDDGNLKVRWGIF